MIKKLKTKIFFIIMLSLSLVVVGSIIFLAVSNYKNTIDTATLMMDRVTNMEEKKDINGKPEFENIIPNNNIEGLYNILVKDSQVIDNIGTSADEQIEQYAIKASNKNCENGIIGKYIYKVRKSKDGADMVILLENEEAIVQVRKIFIAAAIAAISSLIVIYISAKKLSDSLVKPVEETMEKQRQFISDASHELKTPLAVIEANADVLENEVGKENKWLTYIQTEIESMNKLINELLLLAKIENVDNLKEYKELNLSKEAEIIISMFESMAYEKNVKVISKIQEDVTMNGIKEDVEHILSTLIDNAIKHSEPKKEVVAELAKEKNDIVLQVKNVGEPIPAEERNKIFERFYRIDKSRNRNEKRYGLGLSIAQSTVKKYNGKIEVYCKDGITTFKVSIPT